MRHDGRPRRGIREALDAEGFIDVSILSYTAKYASAFYGPFRGALDSAPKDGDKKTYQMDPGNIREAVRETLLDEAEGADMLMVKPAGLYLDVIAKLRETSTLPLAAYQVSGEYLMIRAPQRPVGWTKGPRCSNRSRHPRAGADDPDLLRKTSGRVDRVIQMPYHLLGLVKGDRIMPLVGDDDGPGGGQPLEQPSRHRDRDVAVLFPVPVTNRIVYPAVIQAPGKEIDLRPS